MRTYALIGDVDMTIRPFCLICAHGNGRNALFLKNRSEYGILVLCLFCTAADRLTHAFLPHGYDPCILNSCMNRLTCPAPLPHTDASRMEHRSTRTNSPVQSCFGVRMQAAWNGSVGTAVRAGRGLRKKTSTQHKSAFVLFRSAPGRCIMEASNEGGSQP